MNPVLAQELRKLGKEEKLELLEQLWDSLDDSELPAMNDEVFGELERRERWSAQNPGHGASIEEIAHGLGVKL